VAWKRKLVLCVIDALAPAMLERAVAAGEAPVLARLIEGGRYIPDCVAAFPSVTPVCAASIVTGLGQDRHLIPGMNWYHRAEARYVEYGSSFRAAQRLGIARQLTDTVYNMNRAHLSARERTVFERLDDEGARTAGTTYLMYRGRHLHEPQRDTALTKLASALMRNSVLGPKELFYADIFASRRTPCRAALGMPGVRDRHSGCVGAYLVEHDLFDFLLLSLPDNDWHSHRYGVEAQPQSIAQADLQLARVMDAGGGVERFLGEHAVIVMADHSQAPVQRTIALQDELAGFDVLGPGNARRTAGAPARIAVSPSQRAAMVYLLYAERRQALLAAVVKRALELEGVELALWLEPDGAASRRGVIAGSDGARLRFAPGGEIGDRRGGRWWIEGELGVIGGELVEGVLHTPAHPDVLARAWSALSCPTSGEILLSAAPEWEFLDWGGQAHVGGASHGSMRSEDSLGALVLHGVEGDCEPPGPPDGDARQWAIRDVAHVIYSHFALATLD
jgi:Type I phosphodiesterase / nucleotide pyrophosphatase